MPLSDGRRAFLESSKDELAKELKADTLYDELIEAGVINEEKKKELKVSGSLYSIVERQSTSAML